MTKAKGTKAAAKATRKDAKPAPKGAPAKTAKGAPAAKPAPAKAAPKAAKPAPAAKPAARVAPAKAAPVTKPTKAAPAAKPAAKAAPAAKPEVPSTPAPAVVDGTIIKKKKVKRGAPPMLPRRVPRAPLPPREAGAAPPPPKPTTPGSLHAPARVPEGAEKLKANLTRAINLIQQLKNLKRNLHRQYWEAARILLELSTSELYQAKGYNSFESFIEREIERELGIGRSVVTDYIRIYKIFQKEAAEEIGLDRLRKALKEIYPEPGAASASSSGAASG